MEKLWFDLMVLRIKIAKEDLKTIYLKELIKIKRGFVLFVSRFK